MTKVLLLNSCSLHGSPLAADACCVPQIFKCWLSLVEHIPRVMRGFLGDLRPAQFPDVGESLLDTLRCPHTSFSFRTQGCTQWLLTGFLTLERLPLGSTGSHQWPNPSCQPRCHLPLGETDASASPHQLPLCRSPSPGSPLPQTSPVSVIT